MTVTWFAVLTLALTATGGVTLSAGRDYVRPPELPRSMSGLAYAGGKTYYTIAEEYGSTAKHVESWHLYKMEIDLDKDGKTVSGVRLLNHGVALEGGCDVEAVAYDPLNGTVWAADETKQSIGEFNPETGKCLRLASFPDFLRKTDPWFGFEGLVIAGDGLTMWAANEEALTVDDSLSSPEKGTTVRLVKFTRTDARADWSCVAMYPYTVSKWTQRYSYGKAGRRGVSELAVLPDGSLLVLERELSSRIAGTSLLAGAGVTLVMSLVRVTPEALAAVPNVKDIPSLKESTAWKPVAQEVLWSRNVGWSNYEGLCLGTRLADSAYSVLAVTDKGDEPLLNAKILPFVLGGLKTVK